MRPEPQHEPKGKGSDKLKEKIAIMVLVLCVGGGLQGGMFTPPLLQTTHQKKKAQSFVDRNNNVIDYNYYYVV